METARCKFENDPHYNALVNMFEGFIEKGEFTPSEIREAFIFALTRFEMRRPSRYMIFEKDTSEKVDRMNREFLRE